MRSILLALALVLTPVAMANFSDVPADHPHAAAIEYVQQQGIVEGYDDGTYKPDALINRAEFVKILLEATDQKTYECHYLAPGPFSDVDITIDDLADINADGTKPHIIWYAQYVLAAECRNIVDGYPDGTFQPGWNVNWAEAAKIVVETYKITPGQGMLMDQQAWYLQYTTAIAAPRAGMQPGDKLTRGEMAQIIYQLRPDGVSDVTSTDITQVVAAATAATTDVTWGWDDAYWFISSSNLPDHETGQFPNSGNPNTISAQEYEYRITRTPIKSTIQTPTKIIGVALNGVFFEPGTAEFWNDDRDSGWNLEAIQDVRDLGLDDNNAHVQPNGAYHYHGVPTGAVTNANEIQLVGFAADGFPMYYTPTASAYTSSWELKTGTRPDPVGGDYDGAYTQDFEYVVGSGTLDECNGVNITSAEYPEGTYAYFVTHSFPYIGRCLWGMPDTSFEKGPGGPPPGGTNQPPRF